jgi:hypothetical protein
MLDVGGKEGSVGRREGREKTSRKKACTFAIAAIRGRDTARGIWCFLAIRNILYLTVDFKECTL